MCPPPPPASTSGSQRSSHSPLGPRKHTYCAPSSMPFAPHRRSRSDTRTPVQVEQLVPEGPLRCGRRVGDDSSAR